MLSRTIHDEQWALMDRYGRNPTNDSLAGWQFSHEIRIGDLLIVKKGRSLLLGWGKVTGDYRYESERREYRHVRDVEWHALSHPYPLGRPIAMKTLTLFSSDRKWLRQHFPHLDESGRRKTPPPLPRPKPYDIASALRELFVDQTQLSRILDAIALRKNLTCRGRLG